MNEQAIEGLLTVSDRVSTAGDWVTPLLDALDGVDAAEAAWKPAPEERSIWEIVHHVIAWADWATNFLRGKDTDVTDWPPVMDAGADAWQATRERLNTRLAAFREQIAAIDPNDLFGAPAPEVTPTNRFIAINSILVHNAYHAGQITKLRERWRAGKP